MKVSDAIRAWLETRRKQGILASISYGVLTMVGGLIFLGLTFWVLFMVTKLALLSTFPLFRFHVPLSGLIALLLCAVICADSLRAERDDMSSIPGWLLREYIGIGPRLVFEGYPHLLRARIWIRLDLETCANVLTFLSGRNTPVNRRELQRIFPGLNWERLISELRLLPGVLFFQPDATRVTLTLPLRLELRRLRVQTGQTPFTQQQAEPETVPINDPHPLTPAEILGVAPAASLAEIKAAYRRRIKECHPDKFAALDQQSRSLAEEWTKSLNAAYETLLAERRPR